MTSYSAKQIKDHLKRSTESQKVLVEGQNIEGQKVRQFARVTAGR